MNGQQYETWTECLNKLITDGKSASTNSRQSTISLLCTEMKHLRLDCTESESFLSEAHSIKESVYQMQMDGHADEHKEQSNEMENLLIESSPNTNLFFSGTTSVCSTMNTTMTSTTMKHMTMKAMGLTIALISRCHLTVIMIVQSLLSMYSITPLTLTN